MNCKEKIKEIQKEFEKMNCKEKIKEIQKEFEKKINNKIPAPYDNIEILSNNGYTFYKYAQLEKNNYNETGWCYCESARTFYIDSEKMSTSGGSFQTIDVSKLKYKGTTKRKVWIWGDNGPCAGGGVDFSIPVNNWTYETNKKYIPLVCGRYPEKYETIYKYYIEVFDKPECCFHSHKVCFRTFDGFKRYLRNTGLKIGKKLNFGTRHEIKGDFDFVQHLNLKEYEAAKGDLKEFPLLDNGSYTAAFYKDGEVHFCNCNVHSRKKYPYIPE